MSTEVKLKEVRLAFPVLFTPTKFDEKDAKAKFRATFLMEPGGANEKAVRAAMLTEAINLWKDKAKAIIKSLEGQVNKCSFQNGNLKPDLDGYAGMVYLNASNAVRPRVVDRDGKTPLGESDGKPYAGCYVNAVVAIAAMTKMGNGIYGYLKGVQFVKDGDAFGGGAPLAEDAFSDLADTGADEDLGV